MLILLLVFAIPAFVLSCQDSSHCHSHAEESALTTSQVVADMKDTVEKSKAFLHTMESALQDYVVDVEAKMLANARQLENSLLLASKDDEESNCKARIIEALEPFGFVYRQDPEKCEATRAARDTTEKEGFAPLPSHGGRFRSVAHGTYLSSNESDRKISMAAGPAKAWENWLIELQDGKVYLRTLHSYRYLRHNYETGRVDITEKRATWEAWKPFKNADGTWSLQSKHGAWLSADKNGVVRMVRKRDIEQRFEFEPWTTGAQRLIAEYGRQISLLSTHKRFVRSDVSKSITDQAPEGPPTVTERWIVENASGLVILRPSQHPTRSLSVRSNGTVYLADEKADEIEKKWRAHKNDDGSWSFQNPKQSVWLCAARDGSLLTVAPLDMYEHFWIEEWN